MNKSVEGGLKSMGNIMPVRKNPLTDRTGRTVAQNPTSSLLYATGPEISSTCTLIVLQIKLTSILKVIHEDSF